LRTLENACTYQVLIEKPFSVDEDSAKTLHKQLLEVFSEENIHRIDHFLIIIVN
jgi:glucose-6-phosphate 1-dehydrogenase